MTPTAATKFLQRMRELAAVTGTTLGRQLVTELDPGMSNPDVFNSEDDKQVEAWFWATWVTND